MNGSFVMDGASIGSKDMSDLSFREFSFTLSSDTRYYLD